MVNVLFPKDAGDALSIPVVKRCTNCEDYDTCTKLEEMKRSSRYKALLNMVHRTRCDKFKEERTIIIDDEGDISRLLAMQP